MTARNTLTEPRLEALRKVAAGRVEYQASAATYWIDGVAAAGWDFRHMSDLVRMGLVSRPAGSTRASVALTEAGREVLSP